MIINAYAVLDGFLALLRLPLAMIIIALAWHAWRHRRETSQLEAAEGRYYLLVLLALLLGGLNLLGWPLFYMLLQSYVPQWPGVMCMYGVTRIGLGSAGASRFLPGLVEALQIAKPLVVFAGGAWFALYLTNRSTRRSDLVPATLVLLMVFGLVSAADAALEGAYLAIPKSEKFLAVGCCAAAVTDMERAARFVPSAMLGEAGRGWLGLACFALNVGLPGGLLLSRFRIFGLRLAAPLAAGLLALPLNFAFLVEVAAPKILRLPYHHCAYDLLAAAPETALGIASFLLGLFAIGWACLVDRLGRRAVRREEIERAVRRLLFVSAVAVAASLVLFAAELALV